MSDSVSIGFCRLRRCLRRTQLKRVKVGELAQWITTRGRDTGYAVSERALATHRHEQPFERIMREMRRYTLVVGAFPDGESST